MEGFITLDRKILEWEWYTDPNTMRLFVHLLLQANHKDGKWRGIIIKRGQRITSLNKLSIYLKLSIKQIRTSLKKLEMTGEVANKSTNKYRIITLLKYDEYQNQEKQRASKGQARGKQRATNNNDNKEKNNISCTKIRDFWNEKFPNKKIREITQNRKNKLNSRLDNSNEKDIYNAIEIASTSKFINEWNNFSFDWLFKNDDNYNKVLENKYNNDNNGSTPFGKSLFK